MDFSIDSQYDFSFGRGKGIIRSTVAAFTKMEGAK